MTDSLLDADGNIDVAKWNAEVAEIFIDNKPATLDDVARVKKAQDITVNQARGSVRLQDGLKVGSISFYHCSGDIVLGEHTRVKTMATFTQCLGIRSIPKDFACGMNLRITRCPDFESIAAGLVINKAKERTYGVMGLTVIDCPEFTMLHGPATINGFISILQSPKFMGVSPEIEQDTFHGALTDTYNRPASRFDTAKNEELAMQELRDLWTRNEMAKAAPTIWGAP